MAHAQIYEQEKIWGSW